MIETANRPPLPPPPKKKKSKKSSKQLFLSSVVAAGVESNMFLPRFISRSIVIIGKRLHETSSILSTLSLFKVSLYRTHSSVAGVKASVQKICLMISVVQ